MPSGYELTALSSGPMSWNKPRDNQLSLILYLPGGSDLPGGLKVHSTLYHRPSELDKST
jgi:hypothetical protein